MTFRAPALLEQYRVRTGYYATTPTTPYGSYTEVRSPEKTNVRLCIMAVDGLETGWDHVSVSTRFRCPTWGEMDWVKRMFWEDDATVIQIHPPVEKHINVHQYCLHLWRPLHFPIPLPPEWTIA